MNNQVGTAIASSVAAISQALEQFGPGEAAEQLASISPVFNDVVLDLSVNNGDESAFPVRLSDSPYSQLLLLPGLINSLEEEQQLDYLGRLLLIQKETLSLAADLEQDPFKKQFLYKDLMLVDNLIAHYNDGSYPYEKRACAIALPSTKEDSLVSLYVALITGSYLGHALRMLNPDSEPRFFQTFLDGTVFYMSAELYSPTMGLVHLDLVFDYRSREEDSEYRIQAAGARKGLLTASSMNEFLGQLSRVFSECAATEGERALSVFEAVE